MYSKVGKFKHQLYYFSEFVKNIPIHIDSIKS